MMTRIILAWAWDNRTKLTGYLQIGIGTLIAADSQALIAVFGESGRYWLLVVGGVVTALIGHYNTRNAPPQ